MVKKMIAPFDLAWLQNKNLQKLLDVLKQNSEDARVVGGAVRNALLNREITDIDIATTCEPDIIIKYAVEAGFKAIATGLEHGTVTIVTTDKTFEVTSLRQDVKTDGRHAHVVFTKNWEADANRRDFTINALYLTSQGEIYDYVNGLKDIKTKYVKFIGDASQRIKEDYLRILRFFRFYAYYGLGAPDRDALLSCTALKFGLERISAERIWTELKKILIAPNPLRAILWMRKTEILNLIIPQSAKWGVDLLPLLLQAEEKFTWNIQESPLLRLQAIIPKRLDSIISLGKKLKLSNKELKRLTSWTKVPILDDNIQIDKFLFLYGRDAVIDNIKLTIAQNLSNSCMFNKLLYKAKKHPIPIFEITGKDLLNLGMKPGKDLGKILQQLKLKWLESNCKLTKEELLKLFVIIKQI